MNKVRHFDTIVSVERVEYAKPNPGCFLLSARDFGVQPDSCVVFEDSFDGIEAGHSGGMTIFALTTTHTAENLRDKVDTIIPDFANFGLDNLSAITKI